MWKLIIWFLKVKSDSWKKVINCERVNFMSWIELFVEWIINDLVLSSCSESNILILIHSNELNLTGIKHTHGKQRKGMKMKLSSTCVRWWCRVEKEFCVKDEWERTSWYFLTSLALTFFFFSFLCLKTYFSTMLFSVVFSTCFHEKWG